MIIYKTAEDDKNLRDYIHVIREVLQERNLRKKNENDKTVLIKKIKIIEKTLVVGRFNLFFSIYRSI